MKKVITFLSVVTIISLITINFCTYEKVSTHTVSFDNIEKMTVGETLVNLEGYLIQVSSKTEKELWLHNYDYETFTLETHENIFGLKKYHAIDKVKKVSIND